MKIYNRYTLIVGFLLTIAFILLISESDNILTLILTKVIGFSLALITFKLLHYFENNNKIHIEE